MGDPIHGEGGGGGTRSTLTTTISDNKSKLVTAKNEWKKSSVKKVIVKFEEGHMQHEIYELNRLKPGYYHMEHKM